MFLPQLPLGGAPRPEASLLFGLPALESGRAAGHSQQSEASDGR
ncbi:hypothetical protein OHA61_09620 [Streptomyces sp. NBC_00885]|nr:hypothetical protein OHA61_09620 [Streptomyces sp. NBC_00885]